MDRKYRARRGPEWLAILFLVSVGLMTQSRSVRADEDLQLRLVWVNTVTEFPLAFDLMAGEVGFIFAGMDVEVVWSDTTSTLLDRSVPSLRVVLTPTEPSTWGLGEETMGVAPRAGGSGASVYVFLGSILRVLGFDLEGDQRMSPEDRRAIARAVARVVSHEVVHVLDQRPGHASRGIISPKLDRHFLGQPKVQVWPATGRVVRAGLLAWKKTDRDSGNQP